MRSSFYALSFEDLKTLFSESQLPPEGPQFLFNWHYKRNQRRPCEHHNLSRSSREFINTQLDFALPKFHSIRESADKTVKFLFELKDGARVESVLIPFQNKYTLCLSSQVGCAMNCAFCFTGEQGFKRHLQTDEIVGQFVLASEWLSLNRPHEDRVLNIVYMGQGEPLHNFDAVAQSAKIFISQSGISLATHKVTISTAGYLPGLARWKTEMPDVNIALSLHSPFVEKRNRLIPIGRRYPLAEVLELIESIPRGEKRFVTYEYLLLEDFNDSGGDAHALGQLLKGKKAYINLIPFNPYPGTKFRRPTSERVTQFKEILDSYQIPTLIRKTKGDEILAACGQLNTQLNGETA